MLIKDMKPMLARSVGLDDVKYPIMFSEKLDGVRCIATEDGFISRSGKLFPNKDLQSMWTASMIGLDGELCFPSLHKKDSFKETIEIVMSHDKPIGTLKFYVFDSLQRIVRNTSFKDAYKGSFFYQFCTVYGNKYNLTHRVRCQIATSKEDVENWLKMNPNSEGVIFRDPDSKYVQGRCLSTSQALMKYKPFQDAEAIVLDIIEEQDIYGNSKDTAGKIVAVCNHKIFRVSSGLTKQLKQELWNNKEQYIGKLITFSYLQETENSFRHPVFKCFRSPLDLD